jgi:hypothetical protein
MPIMAVSNRIAMAIAMLTSVHHGNAAFMTSTRSMHRLAHSNSSPTQTFDAPRLCIMTQLSKVTTLLRSKLGGIDDVFLLSIDGTLASTSRSRSFMAVCVALKVWPTLTSNMEALGINHEAFSLENEMDVGYKNDDEESYEWLLQKLSALSSITQQGNDPDAMLGCDEVFMVRILLEEQLLDGGRSNGRGGKYGGKFHPSTSSSADGQGKSVVGSRPLTVGELYANWSELRDVTRMKYPFIEVDSNGKAKQLDPLPYIRQYMKETVSKTHQGERHGWQSLALDVLFDYQSDLKDVNGGRMNLRKNTMLLLGHDVQTSSTINSLSLLGYEFDVETDLINPADDGLPTSTHENSNDKSDMKVVVTTSSKAQGRLGQGLLLVVPDAQTGETHSNMIERIVFGYCEGSQVAKNICVIHSSLEVLKKCKPFLGEDA